MMNCHCYSNSENRVCYREENIKEGVAIKEPKRRYATLSLRQKLKVGRAWRTLIGGIKCLRAEQGGLIKARVSNEGGGAVSGRKEEMEE